MGSVLVWPRSYKQIGRMSVNIADGRAVGRAVLEFESRLARPHLKGILKCYGAGPPVTLERFIGADVHPSQPSSVLLS